VEPGTFASLASIPCPYCGRPLKWTPDQWQRTFECDRCGAFSHPGSAPLADRDCTPMPHGGRPGISEAD
jgi:hypothetical protein